MSKQVLCWHCGHVTLFEGPLSFRAECEKCRFSLHCCCNCQFYQPGKPNDCAIPNTDFISDRQANNFCEYFAPNPQLKTAPTTPSQEIEKRLFGDSTPPKKNSFDDLFS